MITVDSDDESPDEEEQLGKGKNLVRLSDSQCVYVLYFEFP